MARGRRLIGLRPLVVPPSAALSPEPPRSGFARPRRLTAVLLGVALGTTLLSACGKGSYTVTAQAFGFNSVSKPGVAVTQGNTTTENFALHSVPSRNLSGTITDGSGHAWPLYAKITIDGVPGGAIYTSPYTGHYSVNLPQQHSYTLHVSPVYPGYNTRSLTVHIGTADRVLSAKAFVDSSTCSAAGYAYKYRGTSERHRQRRERRDLGVQQPRQPHTPAGR